MFDEGEVFVVSVALIAILSAMTVAHFAKKRRCRFWIRPSLLARKRYSATDFMKDLILDDADLLSLEYTSLEQNSRIFFECPAALLNNYDGS